MQCYKTKISKEHFHLKAGPFTNSGPMNSIAFFFEGFQLFELSQNFTSGASSDVVPLRSSIK
jgi:hypothetical protein